MVANLCMLAAMMAAVVLCSFVASLIPGRPVPEVVFFVVAGVVLGPGCLGVVNATPGLDLVSRLGMGLLFLMAGYELDLRELTGAMGRHAALCWAVSFVAALLLTPALGLGLDQTGVAAFSIALTTTAYGTLVPIMRDRELGGTSVGEVIESYGAMGEILPVVAMSLLLSPSRSLGANVAVLVGFVAFCVFVASRGRWAAEMGSRLSRFLHENAESSSQPTLRAVVALLCALLAIAAVLDLDAVRASTSLPLVTPSVEIDGHKYVDGGVADSVPIEHVLEEAGFDRAVVIVTQDRSYEKKPYEFMPAARARYADYPYLLEAIETRHDRYNIQRMHLWKYEREGRALVVAPQNPVEVGHVEHDPAKLLDLYIQGRQEAKRLLSDIEAFVER